jgi:DNA-binding NtrC family response regulator
MEGTAPPFACAAPHPGNQQAHATLGRLCGARNEIQQRVGDPKMPGLSGLEVVGRLHATKPKLPIIMITAFGTTETAIEATKLSAYDYLLMPFDMAEMLDSSPGQSAAAG